MNKKAILGSALLGLTIILLTMSGSFTQANMYSNQIKTLPTELSPVFVEEMRVTAGIDAAAVVELDLMGGDLPAIATNPLFDDVRSWAFVASDQADFHDYILRRPFKSPDNATLLLEINGALGASGSLARAVQIALLFNGEYGVSLMWSRAELLPWGSYLYYFTGGMTNTIFNTLVAEYQSDITSGFAQLLDATVIASSPVKVAFMGSVPFDGVNIVARGIYYVDTDAITGTSTYTLSTNNLFGENVMARVGLGPHFSVLKFRFPYTINPLSITPKTDNFAPQITGKMDWNLNAPWMVVRPALNYEVVFNIDHAALASAPRVSVNMAYDQAMLNDDGRLQMDYNITNTGTEDAVNIDISYPLGPDFLDFLATKPNLWDLRDDVTIDEGYVNTISATITTIFTGELFADEGIYPDQNYTQVALILDGWYQYANLSYVDISPITEVVVESDGAAFVYDPTPWLPDSGDEIGGDVTTEIILSSPDGLPYTLIDLATQAFALINILDYTVLNIQNIFADYLDELRDIIVEAGDDLFNLLYTEQSIFDPDLMDFGFSVRETGRVGVDAISEEVFLNTTIPLLHPDESVSVSWALDNIPAKDNRFGMMGIAEVDVGASYSALKLSTVERTGYDLMRFLFGIGDPGMEFTYSRPLSYYNRWEETWTSEGAKYKYNDPEGFEYFGFSNGINLQVADEEAVLNVHVSLNQTAYQVGDPVGIDYYIENTGDIPAENVVLYLAHGSMAADWQMQNPELFWRDEIGTINDGQTYVGHADVLANSFLGIHPVYAIVEFDSDYGQVPAEQVVNFAPGLVTVFEGAGETHQQVLSNMDWGLVLPKTQNRRPAFPQPVLEIDVEVTFIIPENAPWELQIDITITNIGDDRTHVTAIQFYNASEMQLLHKTTTEGFTANITSLGVGVILFQGITLLPGESVELSMRWLFLTSNGCYIPGIIIIYDSRFENELGDEEVIQTSDNADTAPMLAAMDGQAQDEEEWEDYGQSTQTGSSAGADVFTGGTHTRRLGTFETVIWSISAIFVTAFVVTLRKKTKL